eukprot:Nitzschia sp. Nitz4//scaffold72_size95085//74414//75943//NITZ4_004768-RA/size95085-processed-gene-0.35-mRNA-1//-1//CDS//3329557399//8060//frame0
MTQIRSRSFQRLVQSLKKQQKTCAVVESCCGGLINASIMAVPGSSSVYYGGSVAYNTKKSQKLLLNDKTLHSNLVQSIQPKEGESEADTYIRSKQSWTAQTAAAFCEQLDVDYAIAEGGASGPTFRPQGMDKGFSVIAIAGRDSDTSTSKILAQKTIHSPHNQREANMRLFADAAADLLLDTMGEKEEPHSALGTSPISDSQAIDRATHLRMDEQALKEFQARDDAKYVVLRDSKECLFASSTELAYAFNVPDSFEKTFLGLDPEGSPIFAINGDNAALQTLDLPPDATFDNTRTHAPLLRPYDLEMALYATALANWRRTHKFCSVCGQPLAPAQGGTCLQCTACQNMSWPRQDPSIIVLVTNPAGDKALLARSPRHPPKLHTTLAGFVEAGETFERAVVREVAEETGAWVDPDSISYICSQPWPFPRSCMIGFVAVADDSTPLNIDPDEIVSAAWYDKSQVGTAAQITGPVMDRDIANKVLEDNPSLELLIPPQGVVARTLIDAWLHR